MTVIQVIAPALFAYGLLLYLMYRAEVKRKAPWKGKKYWLNYLTAVFVSLAVCYGFDVSLKAQAKRVAFDKAYTEVDAYFARLIAAADLVTGGVHLNIKAEHKNELLNGLFALNLKELATFSRDYDSMMCRALVEYFSTLPGTALGLSYRYFIYQLESVDEKLKMLETELEKVEELRVCLSIESN